MIGYESSGSFRNTDSFLRKILRDDVGQPEERIAEEGVAALSAATPQGDTGITSRSWDYEIEETDTGIIVWWINRNVVDGVFNVAAGIQYGHATGNGGYVPGYDYINPALRPIFDRMSDQVWEEVKKA